jgi:O-6-methylguanine DNA methyltransferase
VCGDASCCQQLRDRQPAAVELERECRGPQQLLRATNVATNVAARTSDYQTARQVGWGRTTTYGALAKELGAGPEAARDVGQAMARNPVALIIPCHRVLAAGGKIGGFSAPGGSGAKIRMLALEGVRAEPPRPTQRSFAF